jgi:hypothetical protein
LANLPKDKVAFTIQIRNGIISSSARSRRIPRIPADPAFSRTLPHLHEYAMPVPNRSIEPATSSLFHSGHDNRRRAGVVRRISILRRLVENRSGRGGNHQHHKSQREEAHHPQSFHYFLTARGLGIQRRGSIQFSMIFTKKPAGFLFSKETGLVMCGFPFNTTSGEGPLRPPF